MGDYRAVVGASRGRVESFSYSKLERDGRLVGARMIEKYGGAEPQESEKTGRWSGRPNISFRGGWSRPVGRASKWSAERSAATELKLVLNKCNRSDVMTDLPETYFFLCQRVSRD